MKKSACLYKWLIVSLLLVCSSTALLRAQPSNSTLTGLVSWWKAEGNGLDSVGGNTAYAAFLPGGATFAPGEVGQAFQLNDTNAYLVVPASPSLDVGASDGLTMEGWVKVSSVDGLHPIAEWDGDVRNTVGVQIWLNSWSDLSGGLFGVVVDASAGQQHRLLSPQGIMQPNVFQHVALTYDKASGVAALYLNGAVVAQDNIGSFTPLTSGNLWMGHRPFDVPGDITYGTTLGGLLDEFSIYSRALSSNEIAAIYNAGSAGKSGITNSGTAPAITGQPANQTVAAGGTATFSVTATGTAPLFYQWSGPSGAISGATHSSLTLSNVQPAQAGNYFVVVSNTVGSATSTNALLTVTGGGGTNSCTPAPNGLVSLWRGDGNPNDSTGTNNGFVQGGTISYAAGEVNAAFRYTNGSGYVQIPPSPSLNVGQGAGFTVEGWIQPADTVNESPIVEWQYNTNNDFVGTHFWISAIGGAGCLFANLVDASNNNSHWFYSAPGIVTTNYQHVALTYAKSNGVASIYRNGVLVAQANLGSFTPNTTGNLLLGERTYLNGNPQFHYTGGLDEMSLYSRALSSNEIAAIYNAGSAGKCGGTNSNTGIAPLITHQPTNQTVAAGGAATFTVTATGTAPLFYQWTGPSGAISGATHSSLTLSNVQPAQSGNYFVVVSNAFGRATSSNALLTVTGGGGGTNSCTPTPSGIAAWWPGEGNGNDIIHGNNAILESGVIFGPGEVDQAFQLLNYTNGFTHVPASPSLNIGASDGLTMEGWIKVSSVSGFHPIAEYHGNTREQTGVQIWLNSNPYQSGALLGALPDTNFVQHTLVSPAGLVQPDVFQHVALTYDKASGNATLYLNGAVVAQANFGTFEPATTYDFWMGHRPLDVPGDWTYGTTLGGSLDELSLYSRALSSNEIAAIYNAGSAGKCGGITNSGTAPAITHQPTNQTVAAGGTATFSVTATGTAPLFYQWSGPAGAISGASSSSLTLSNVQPAQAGNYFVVVSNAFGKATSSNALLTVTGGGGGTNSCTPRPSGLVSLWKGDNNPNDSAGNNDGQVVGGPMSYAAGKVNTAFNYTNGSGYVQVPAAPALNVGQGAGFTLEGWIQPADIQNQLPVFEWQYNPTNDSGGAHFWISVGGAGCLYANLIDTDNNAHLLSSAPGILTTDFQHVALTYAKSNGVASIYRNGVLVAQANLGSFTPNTTGNLLLGERTYLGGDPQYHYTGKLDEVSLYNRALSSNEIAAIYSAGSAGKCDGTNSGVAPLITKQPTNQTVAAGGAATFTVTATGTAPLFYQWSGPAGAISGATHSSLTLSNIQPAQSGNYFVVVSNAFGKATSSNALLTVTGGGGGTNSCTPPPSGIVAWWRAEGNAIDSINGNNGTMTPGATNAPGKVGLGFLLDGNGYVSVPASSNLDIGTADGLTIEGWIKENDYNQFGGEPIIEWDSDTADGLQLFSEVGLRLYANLKDTSGNNHQIIEDTGTLSTNEFKHVALTYDKSSGMARLYVNGVEVQNANFGNITPQTTYPLNIGARTFAGWGNRFSGIIDELSLYRRALSSNEIAAIYNAGSAGKCGGDTNTGTAPMITKQPTNQTVGAGGTATFSVTATGTAPLFYQWSGPAGAISGATLSSLTLSNVQPSQSGNYFVVVSNAFGMATSSNALLTVTGGGGGTNSCTPPSSGIAAWWPAEGNGTDIIGGNTATPQGGATYAPGEVGQAFLLNGPNDYLSVAAGSNLNVAAGGSFTAEAWIKVSDVAGYHPIVEWNDGASHGGVHMWILPYTGESAGVLFANLVDTSGGSHSFHSPGGSVATNVFQHVAVTYDYATGTGTLYVNGNIVAQQFIGVFMPQTSYPFYLGHRPNIPLSEPDYGSSLGGLLDEPSLYTRALSQSEIAAIYNAGANGKCAPQGSPTPHALINPQPTINVSVSGNLPVLSWPVSAGDFTLQAADSLTAPIKWTNVPATFLTNGDTIEVTLPEDGQHGYFRLYHP